MCPVIFKDALGSVRQLSASNGDVTLAKSYDPYGNVIQSVGSGSSPFAYTGEATDVSGLTYLRARYYASNTGRFQSRDTWGGDANRPMSFNRWNYVDSNPINATDPSGYIKNEAMQATKADTFREKLHDIYNVIIEKDWGYQLIPIPTYYGPTRYNCEWQEGSWRSAHELELTFEAVRLMANKMGGINKFKSAMGNTEIQMAF